MRRLNLPNKLKVYIPLLILLVLLVVLMPRSPKFNYDYQKGSSWMYETLVAKFDFPILKTEDQLAKEKEALSSNLTPYYKMDLDISDTALSMLAKTDLGDSEELRAELTIRLSEIYNKGVLRDTNGLHANKSKLAFVQKDKRVEELAISSLYTIEDAHEALKSILARHNIENLDSIYIVSGLHAIVSPNLVFDEATTALVQSEVVNYISPTLGVVNAGTTLISKGEIITAEIAQILDSYKEEYEAGLGYQGHPFLQWLGNILLALCIVIVLFFSILYTNPNIFTEYNKYLYLLFIVAITAIAALLTERINPKYIYLIPFPLIAMYLMAFFRKRVIWIVYIVSLLPLLIFSHNGIQVFTMFLIAGLVAIYAFEYFNKGWLQFITAMLVFVSLAFTWTIFLLINGIDGYIDWKVPLYLFIGSMLSVAGYPLIYLFERIFNLVSTSRLVELTDTNNKLLRDMAANAPGSFQHSLQVMNLADSVARKLDADVALVRAGALYHDIGKLNNPQCFVENEAPGVKYHKGLTPIESAKEILKHVLDGVTLAKKYNLPDVVIDFILSHHGTTTVSYFYSQHVLQGGSKDSISEFTYTGLNPQTKEQVIIMMADALEAASRTLKDYSQESIDELVERIVDGKISEGQVEEADITLKEINTLKSALKEYLQQMHHARVVYPKKAREAK